MASVESLPMGRTLPAQDARVSNIYTDLIERNPCCKINVSWQNRLREQVARSATERGILLVKTSDLPLDGLLSERQKQWVNSAAYDGRTQNPVIYKLVTSLITVMQTITVS